MRLAKRMTRLGGGEMGTILNRVAELRSQGQDVIPLHAGEPDFDTPRSVVDAAVGAMREGHTHYAPASGIHSLRETVAEHVAKSRQIPVHPEQVIIVPGAKPMLYFAILALCQEGDEVICPDPAYPFYASIARFVGAKAVSLPLLVDTGFGLDLDLLKSLVTDRTRLIVLNSPSNPTGGVVSRAELQALADVVLEHDLYVLSDEIYSHIVYDAPHESIISLPHMADRTILVDGHSKTYAMTGWRLGYGVMPKELAPQISRLVLNTISGTATFTQIAGAEAIHGAARDVEKMVTVFRSRRDQMVSQLNRIPNVTCLMPQGAFYAFPRVELGSMKSLELSTYLLDEVGVATYPGSAFGDQGEGHIRLSFACSASQIGAGIDRIADALAKL